MPNNEGSQAMHRKGMKTNDDPSGWVNINHPETKSLSDDNDDNEPSMNTLAFDRQGDWQPHDPESSIPLWNKAYMRGEAAVYKGYRRSTEVAAWAGEVGAKVAAAVGGGSGETCEKSAKLKKE